MKKTKITNHQLFALTVSQVCGTSIIIVSAGLAGIAKQDAWISVLLTPVFGMFFIWMYSYLGSLYPDKSYVEVICSVFGKWIGGFIAGVFIFLCLLDVPQITWYVGNFIVLEHLRRTPIYVINAVMTIALVIALLYGIEAISRSFEILVYIVSFLLLLSFILVSPNIQINNVLPVLEKGIIPVLKGSFLLSSYTTWPVIVLNMIYPSHFDNIRISRKALFLGYIWASIIIFLSTVMSILVLGSSVSARSQFPIYILVREINIGIIFTRMEAIISGVWIITLFSKTVIYFYGGVIGFSQLIGLKDYKKIILPLGLICLVYSDIVYKDAMYEAEWDSVTWVPWIATFAIVLPIVLIIIYKFKQLLIKK